MFCRGKSRDRWGHVFFENNVAVFSAIIVIVVSSTLSFPVEAVPFYGESVVTGRCREPAVIVEKTKNKWTRTDL